MTSHVPFAAAGLCILAAAQPARADSIACTYSAGPAPSGITVGANGGANAFEIDGIAFDLEQGNPMQAEAAAREAKVRVHDLTFTKKIDKSSPTLFLLAAAGTPLTSVSCSFYAEIQATGAPQMSITFVYDQLQWKF